MQSMKMYFNNDDNSNFIEMSYDNILPGNATMINISLYHTNNLISAEPQQR